MPKPLSWRQAVAAALLALFLPLSALALPKESGVPGGITMVRLGAVTNQAAPPRAWLVEQPV